MASMEAGKRDYPQDLVPAAVNGSQIILNCLIQRGSSASSTSHCSSFVVDEAVRPFRTAPSSCYERWLLGDGMKKQFVFPIQASYEPAYLI